MISTALLLCSCSSGGTAEIDSPATQTTLRVGGSSETYSVLTQLTNAYAATAEHVSFEFLPPSQTDSAIQGVISGELDIGGVSRPIESDEQTSDLSYTVITTAPLVMVVHDSVTGVTNLNADQIKAIYSGEINNWQQLGGPDAEIVLLDLSEDENEKQLLRATYLGEDLAVTPKAIVFAEDDELLETVASTEYSLAAVPDEEEIEALPVMELSVDGIAPSAENIATSTYPMSMTLGMVSSAAAEEDIAAFIEFAEGPEGQAILADDDDDDDDD